MKERASEARAHLAAAASTAPGGTKIGGGLGGSHGRLADGRALGLAEDGAQKLETLQVGIQRGSVEVRHGGVPLLQAGFGSSGHPGPTISLDLRSVESHTS